MRNVWFLEVEGALITSRQRTSVMISDSRRALDIELKTKTLLREVALSEAPAPLNTDV